MVVTNASFPPFLCNKELVATVVPCASLEIWSFLDWENLSFISSKPFKIAMAGSSGVDGLLWITVSPELLFLAQKSVNVPPTSTPIIQLIKTSIL